MEVNPKSIANANKSVEILGEKNCSYTYETMDANKHMQKMIEENKKFDLIILDPPREGMSGGVAELIKLAPKDILYVSCDPQTLARDIAKLNESGYEIVEFKALDFFPQTYHIESFVHLSVKINRSLIEY